MTDDQNATPADLFALGQSVLAGQPFSVLLGTRLLVMTAGNVEMELPIQPTFAQHAGFVHGGVISYMADSALTFAGGSILGAEVLTAEFKINYLKPGQGEKLIARATVISTTARQTVCRCDVFGVRNGQEYLCATALGTIAKR